MSGTVIKVHLNGKVVKTFALENQRGYEFSVDTAAYWLYYKYDDEAENPEKMRRGEKKKKKREGKKKKE